MKRENIYFLIQLIRSLEDAELKLEESYKKGNAEDFNRIKKFMIQIEKQILGVLR